VLEDSLATTNFALRHRSPTLCARTMNMIAHGTHLVKHFIQDQARNMVVLGDES
jgi:hypothetical protein